VIAIIFTIVLVACVIAFWKETPETSFKRLRTLSDWSTGTFRSRRNVPMPLLWIALAIVWIGVAFALRGLLRKDPPDK
jgi:hypothetical protein